jgi:hypothetical protein
MQETLSLAHPHIHFIPSMPVSSVRPADFYFTLPGWELAALREYHGLIEANLPDLISARGLPEIDGEDGRTMVANLHQQMVDSMLPSTFRTPILLSAWAVFESALVEIADYFYAVQLASCSLTTTSKRVRGGRTGILDRARIFYRTDLGFEVFDGEAAETEIRTFYRLRNILIHAGGRKGARSREWDSLEKEVGGRSGIDLSAGVVVVSREYVEGRLEIVHQALAYLVRNARDVLHQRGREPHQPYS